MCIRDSINAEYGLLLFRLSQHMAQRRVKKGEDEDEFHDESKLDQAQTEIETKPDEESNEQLEQMRLKVKKLQEEAERLEELQKQAEQELGGSGESSKEIDGRSIYIGNVDYGATPEELQAHFQSCGTINRVTILVDKFSGRPKGYAYIEFVEQEAVPNALVLNESLFRGRQIKVFSQLSTLSRHFLKVLSQGFV
eukprot:TRINITY_DN3366_c0_g2_i2.p1 TRINITY_DN3366_c0_g2~~TRINITY_DN3366_c0_g2_i2.p1  ORF type:complete len:195 (+),score=59.55 TRINITY_DN3366_c0_g2_i2:1-585(+)